MPRPFPFPPPPEGDITAWHGGGDPDQLLARDVAVVRWFIEERRGVRINERSPLADMLVRSEQYLRGATFPGMSGEEWQHDLYAQAQLVRLSWAIRALYGRGAAVECIDDSFIDKELLRGDDTGSVRQLAGGIGLLVLAGRIVQSRGGRIIAVSGNGRRGYDIKWQTTLGDTVYLERKDRAFSAGLSDNTAARVRKVIRDVQVAGPKMPQDLGAFRAVMVGFHHLVRRDEQEAVNNSYAVAVADALQRGIWAAETLPDFLVIEHLGFDPQVQQDRANFFSSHVLRMSPGFKERVLPLLARAHGA